MNQGHEIKACLLPFFIPEITNLIFRYVHEIPWHVCPLLDSCIAHGGYFTPWTVAFVKQDMDQHLKHWSRSQTMKYLRQRHFELQANEWLIPNTCLHNPPKDEILVCEDCGSHSFCSEACKLELHPSAWCTAFQEEKSRNFVFRYVTSWMEQDPLGCMTYVSAVTSQITKRLVYKHDQNCRVGFSFNKDGCNPSPTLLRLYLTTPQVDALDRACKSHE